MKTETTLSAPPHPIRRQTGLDAVFQARTVALIGASEKAGSVGRALLENLHSFPGQLFPINPRHDFVLDRRTYPDLPAVPETVDLAIIAVSAAAVPGVVRECVQAGVSAAVIISAGFKERGAAGAELERQVLAEALKGPLQLIGPNSLGVANPHTGLNATFAATAPRPGNIAFISQSGALCSAVLDWSHRENVGFSAFVSVGSMLDVGWGDLISYLNDDPHTHSILLYMESVGDARSFLAAARAAALTKPVIALKAGRTAEAARAAASHTGALSGRDEVFDAALLRAGVLRVESVAELFGMAGVLASQPIPTGPRLAIVTNAGGPGALAADALVLGGGRVAPLVPGTTAALNELLPRHWSHGNPVDVLGDAGPSRFTRAIEIAAADPDTDAVLAILTPQAMTDPSGAARLLPAIARNSKKPLFACWMGGDAVAEGRRVLHEAGIPVFEYPDTASRAFCDLARFGDLRRALRPPDPSANLRATPAAAIAQTAALIEDERRDGRTALSEFESKQLLSRHGIPCVDTHLAHTVKEAVAAAENLGYPVVLKLHSKTIIHKSVLGGVRLNLHDEAAVRGAWDAIHQAVAGKAGREHFLGVTVQPMVHDGIGEIILGSSIDPQFGPVLLFGAGGSMVEVFQDYALGLPPLDTHLARRLMKQTKIFSLLQGARGRPPVDLSRLEQLMVRFSQFVLDQEGIKEIDLNPIVFSDGELLALDARIILQPPQPSAAFSPGPALLPAALHPSSCAGPEGARPGSRAGLPET